jgi:uncharacterized protein YndB with AHSA1/START domain
VPTAEELLERAAERSKQRAAVANVVPRRHVEATVRVAASPHVVMRALCEAAEIWSGASRALVQPHVGGAWALAWDASPGDSRQFSAGRVDAFEEARRLVVAGVVCVRADRPPLGPTTLTFQIAVDGEGSYLRMEEVGFGEGPEWDEFYATEREDWPRFAQRIRDLAEGAVP